MEALPSASGTYVLLLDVDAPSAGRALRVGSLGVLVLEPGRYAYVGSALGAGGLAGRLRHHLRSGASSHWHVDHLRRHAHLAEIWLAEGGGRSEHAWADLLARHARARIPLARFGASDCRCRTHLLHFRSGPGFGWFRRRVGAPGLRRIVPAAAQPCSRP